MHVGGGALRASLAIASLLLLGAAGAHFMLLREPAWMEGAGMWARRFEAATWAPWHLQPAVGGRGLAAPIRAPGAAANSYDQPLHATLHLPDHTQLEVGEGTTLEELVNKLLAAQTGPHSPSSIEVIAVERITVERPSPLRAAASALARTLRLPASWQGAAAAGDSERAEAAPWVDSSAAAGSLAGSVAGQAAAVARERAAGVAAAAAAADEQLAALRAAAEQGGDDEQRLPMAAFDDEYRDDVDEMELPGRRGMLEAREAGAAMAGEEEAWQPVKLFGPRMPALQQLQPALPGVQVAQGSPPVLRVRVIVVLKQRASRSPASLLDELATPAQALGRRAAAGAGSSTGSAGSRVQLQGAISEAVLAQLLSLQQQQQQGQQQQGILPAEAGGAGSQAALLAAVDAVFVGAVVVALVCVALLAVDVAHHGWRRAPASRHRDVEQQQALLAPLLVVAADEAAAWAAATGKR